jgi:hypothetical protein
LKWHAPTPWIPQCEDQTRKCSTPQTRVIWVIYLPLH